MNTDAVQVLRLAPPEFDLSGGQWVCATLERVLGILLEYVLDLFLPVNDGGFEDVGLVLAGGAVGVGNVLWGKGKKSLALNLTDGHVSVGKEAVELLHKVLGD